MKIRTRFISNSSSSSFIIRKSALTDLQIWTLQSLFEAHNKQFETEVKETNKFFSGDLEAHSSLYWLSEVVESNQRLDLADITMSLMEKWGIKNRQDYSIDYQETAELDTGETAYEN